jgi:hypothetical protein
MPNQLLFVTLHTIDNNILRNDQLKLDNIKQGHLAINLRLVVNIGQMSVEKLKYPRTIIRGSIIFQPFNIKL